MTENQFAAEPPSSTPASRPRLAVVETLFVFMVFFLHAASQVPDVNEPHYLGKAKHYWNPDFCQGDTFYESADAHHVFYWSFGWLTLLLPLPQVAWAGRLATWALLAFAWRRLSWALLPRPLIAILTAGLFVLLNSRCHMAGEWIVGGAEAKGFAYGLVLLAIESLLRDRWNRSLLLLGAATSLHVLVGGWSAVALGFTWLVMVRRRPTIRSLVPGLIGAVVLTLPGLVPALMLTQGVDPVTVAEANQIYVFERLPHHLLPQKMKPELITRFSLMLVVWLLLCTVTATDDRVRRLRGFVFGALAISVCGAVISLTAESNPAVAAGLLRFYWFRLADVALPLGVALLGARYLVDLARERPVIAQWWLAGMMLVATWHLGDVMVGRRNADRPPAESAKKVANLNDWLDVCHHIRDMKSLPGDACFLTPRKNHTFKWHTGRREVVTRKDIPQDAENIVQWMRQLDDVFGNRDPKISRRFVRSLAQHGSAELIRIAHRNGATHLLTRSEPELSGAALALKRIYANPTYAVYEIQ